MRRNSGVFTVLADKAGSSLIFVLGVMMLLMAIGVSVLAAASANVGFLIRQREQNQIRILDQSIHSNILHSLQSDPGNSSLLSHQLVMAVYGAADDPGVPLSPLNLEEAISVGIDLADGPDLYTGNIRVGDITFSFTDQTVVPTEGRPLIPEQDEVTIPDPAGGEDIVIVPWAAEIPRVPKTATVDARMIVTVEIRVGPEPRARRITSHALYEYTGGRLDDSDTEGHMMFTTSDGYGAWRLIKHETDS